ncbi:MAG: DUF362 domain-containing protein [Spirochaetales bacterium]|nr:DUF362 domain-containing protein [Spirochaetales bacterium]
MNKADYTVSVRKIKTGIKETLQQSFYDIGGPGKYIWPGARVLLKPNINGTECITNPEVVAAVIEILRDNSAGEIMIAESTFGDAKNTAFCFKQNGYTELAEKYGVKLANLNESEITEIKVDNPLVKDTLKVAREIAEADFLINLPVMKVHYATGITLCLKNLKGVLVGPEKRTFHDLGLNEGINDLNRMIRPTLNIVDCTSCMERMGPKGGDIFRMDLIIAGANPGLTDYAGMKVMGYELDEVRHLKMYLEEHGLDPEKIIITGEDINTVKHDFARVTMQYPGGVKPDCISREACSSCENALLLSLMLAEDIDFSDKCFYLGSGVSRSDNGKAAIAFGKCAIKRLQDAEYRIAGCPPYPFEMKKQLT